VSEWKPSPRSLMVNNTRLLALQMTSKRILNAYSTSEPSNTCSFFLRAQFSRSPSKLFLGLFHKHFRLLISPSRFLETANCRHRPHRLPPLLPFFFQWDKYSPALERPLHDFSWFNTSRVAKNFSSQWRNGLFPCTPSFSLFFLFFSFPPYVPLSPIFHFLFFYKFLRCHMIFQRPRGLLYQVPTPPPPLPNLRDRISRMGTLPGL